jgi:uncharacterized protein
VQLEHQFSVPAPVEVVWKALTDPARVAPCLPGASLSSVDGNSFNGSVKVKLGPISLLYKGSGEFVETDEKARRLVIKASGKDSRGNGTASASVVVTITGGDVTTGTVTSDLSITGRPAQFGRGLISEVGGKILETFANNLAADLASDSAGSTEAPAAEGGTKSDSKSTDKAGGNGGGAAGAERTGGAGAETPTEARPAAAPVDLLDYAGSSVAKRVLPLVAGALVVIFALSRFRRRRRRRRG